MSDTPKPDVRLAYYPQGNGTLATMGQAGPEVRLACNPGPVNAYHALAPPAVRLAFGNSPPERNGTSGLEPPTVRLATTIDGGGAMGPVAFERHLGAPTVRLATQQHAQGDNVLAGIRDVERLPVSLAPALLVSFFYMDPFLKHRDKYVYRDWALDSGAFSAHNSGATIDLGKYTETCARLLAEDPTLTEVFSLDVIGDWRASEKNTRAMWDAGVPAIPTYHVGEPESVLLGLARDYPKIALGGAVGFKQKDAWAAQCFARVWPKAIHGLGFGSEKSLMMLPWHSVDATNWEIGPCKFGRWQTYGQMSVRGSKQNLRAEVEWYLALERRARARWAKAMAKLPAPVTPGPSVRLAAANNQVSETYTRIIDALSGRPEPPLTVRLAAKVSGRDKNFLDPGGTT